MTWLAREILSSTFKLAGATVLFFAAILAGLAATVFVGFLIAAVRASLPG